VPTTVEGFVYALAGMLVLISTYHLGVKYPIKRIARAKRQRSEISAQKPEAR
jgi:hypothetical protein